MVRAHENICPYGVPDVGAVWETSSSLAFNGIAIPLDIVRTADSPIRLMNFGDPEAEDKRNDPRIREVLEAAGKLR